MKKCLLPLLTLALMIGLFAAVGTTRAYAKDSETIIPVYRLYNQTNKEHLYTTNPAEREMCISVGWIDEGIGWWAPQSSDWPVRRLYHAPTGSHVYSQNPVEMEMLVSAGWKLEGVAFYSSQKKSVQVCRQYLPALNLHNYSYNPAEIEMLRAAGWKIEGTAWFASIPPKNVTPEEPEEPEMPSEGLVLKMVDITMDNWDQYFEIRQERLETRTVWRIVLKDTYARNYLNNATFEFPDRDDYAYIDQRNLWEVLLAAGEFEMDGLHLSDGVSVQIGTDFTPVTADNGDYIDALVSDGYYNTNPTVAGTGAYARYVAASRGLLGEDAAASPRISALIYATPDLTNQGEAMHNSWRKAIEENVRFYVTGISGQIPVFVQE